ncbi:LuxR C-terminal-related transcriptional regulator [Actinomadura sp. ATCC 31491]|uniref:LuxR C-terminal-related transcriptional regulator n=1 Tax=Actinomadura luzonensis TaxID=2805427 RepID=A0ABT0FN15_9ACTN|nr:LuxR family transcriptional regulator [Actinomadura luzonensis]MCK2213744.1 LuxR C-terminal-related transcriptional regulator [Actinomadura luzonensis]
MDTLAAQLKTTAEDVRRILERLVGLSLVRAEHLPCGPFRAVRPQFGLSALLARSQAELHERQRQIESTREAIAALADEYLSVVQAGGEVVERLGDAVAARARLEEVRGQAQSECLSLTTSRSGTPAADRSWDQAALARGVGLRGVYQDSFSTDAAARQHLTWLRDAGAGVRTAPTLPMAMVIVDRRAVLTLSVPAVYVEQPDIVATLHALFEHVWQGATPLSAPCAVGGEGLSTRERALLRLLNEGYTDERAARSLGLSLRTTRRLMSSLMTKLQAQSRFQAGARAMQAGWLTTGGPASPAGRGQGLDVADGEHPAEQERHGSGGGRAGRHQ